MAAEPIPTTATSSPGPLLRAGPPAWDRSGPTTTGPVFELVGCPTAGGVTWVWARRDLEMATVAAARREVSALLEPMRDPGKVLVYLGPERFVDLRGLRLLVGVAARVRSRGGALAVVAPPRCVRRMVQLGQLDAELPLFTTARRAVWWARTRGRRSGDGLRR